MKNLRRRASTIGWLLALCWIAAPGGGQAYQLTDDIEVRAQYRGENYFRLTDTDNTYWSLRSQQFKTDENGVLMSQRNEVRIDVEMQLHTERLWSWLGRSRGFVQLRPWYDSVFDWPEDATPAKHQRDLTPFWRSNLNDDLGNNYDPLFREYYLDVAPKHFFFRVGRQIIPWGKSDGVYMLDIVNPFNLRNPTIFEEENFKIPVWALNANWKPTVDGNLQFLYIPQYFPNVWGGINTNHQGQSIESRFHPWTYKIVGFFNDFYNGEFGFQVPVHRNLPNNWITDAITGLRWNDTFKRVNYSLNYLYTWTPNLIDFPDAGSFLSPQLTSVTREPAREHVIGGSADYDVNMGNKWLDGTVFRLETAFTLGDRYYKGLVGNPVDTDHWGVMAGIDRTILTDYLERPVFASLQYWDDLVINVPKSCNGCGPFAGKFQDYGFQGGSQGLRNDYKSLLTLYLYKTFLPGDTVIGEFFVLYELQFQDWWVRPKVTWKINDQTTVAVGSNVFAGGSQTPYGEWKDNTNMFVELRRTLF
jgi:Protein of unknown function (DUF1302)